MVLAETIVAIFIFLVAVGMLYLTKKREMALAYPIIASALFLGNMIYSATIPFVTNASGEVVGTSANIALISLNLIFFVIALIISIGKVFSLFKG